MNLEKELKCWGKSLPASVREQSIKETVKKSIDVFYAAEQERMLTYGEFLWRQLGLIRKRWWCLQTVLLVIVWTFLRFLGNIQSVQRMIGVSSCLFIVLIIPELWKSRTCRTAEIETAAYYSLRQIYASRMLLFGIVDVGLVTLFCALASAALDMALSMLLTQFLFPMTVTACICFGILCSRHSFGETFAAVLCMAWNMAWVFIVLDDRIYKLITYPLWIALFGAALCFFVFAVCRTLNNCNSYWERG